MAGVKDKALIRCLSNWKVPRSFMPQNIYANTEGFCINDSEMIIQFKGDHRRDNPTIEMLIEADDKNILDTAKGENGLVMLKRQENDYIITFQGEIEREIQLSDFFAEDFIQELNLSESHLICITFSPDNIKFLSKFLNIDESVSLIGQEVVLFSMGSTLNVLLKNQEDEWDVSMVKSYAQEVKSLWYSNEFNALFVITSLGVLNASFLNGEDREDLKEEIIFLGQNYLKVPKLIREDELIGITWTCLEVLTIIKEDKFNIEVEKIPLPGAVDVTYQNNWGVYLAVTENRFIYEFSKRTKPIIEEEMHEKWRRNRGRFRQYISRLMENTARITIEAKEDNHVLNCLGFLRNFFVVTHEVTLRVSVRQSLGANVEVMLSLSEKIAQMDVSRESQWSLSVFNSCFRQKFSLEPNKSSYAFMLPEKWLAESPLRVDISVEFSLDGEHFFLAFPLRVIFSVEEKSSNTPLIDFYSKLEALERTSLQEYVSQWSQIEQLNEKKLNRLAMNLQRIVMLQEELPPIENLLEIHNELRSKDG